MSFIVHIWDGRAAENVPADVPDAVRIFERLVRTETRSRAIFRQLGQALWAKFGPGPDADPDDDDDDNMVFEDDPSDWGDDLDAPCRAVWNLWIATDRVDEVLPFLMGQARGMGLVVLDPQNSLLATPPRPPAAARAAVPAAAAPATALAPAVSRFKSQITVESDRIVSTLTSELSEPEKFEKVVADNLASTLEDHGFERRQRGVFERPFSSGKLGISINATVLAGRQMGVDVQVEVTWFLTRRLLAAMPGLRNNYLPGAPSMTSPLQVLASSSASTQDLFAARPPGPYTLVVRDRNEAAQLVSNEVIPMLAAVTDESRPWFENPRTVLALYLHFFLEKNQAPAGFEFVCMEDLLLARLSDSPQFKALAKKRVKDEQAHAAKVPKPSRWSSSDGLKRVFLNARNSVAVNPWLALPKGSEIDGMDDEQAGKHLQRRLLLVCAALVLGLAGVISLAGAKGSPFLAQLMTPLVLLNMPVGAFAIRKAVKLLYGNSLLKTLLPMAALLLPAALVLLAYLMVRIRAVQAGLKDWTAKPVKTA